jgi:hypothetical protein
MSTHSGRFVDPMDIVRELTALPHRGATTDQARLATDILERHLRQLGATVERQAFTTPKTYITEVWWLVGGVVAGLLLIPVLSWLALLLVGVCTAAALLYFDWRDSPVSLLPPRSSSENVVGQAPPPVGQDRMPVKMQANKKLILMGHYDSAPVSLLYLPSMVRGFRQSLRISLGLMVIAAVVALVSVLDIGQPVVTWLSWLLAIYFVAQGLMSTTDYLRFGFTNGAADNATGAAVPVATAERLWRRPIPGCEVELVLTGAEEANLKGSRAYYLASRRELDPEKTYVFNFDNLGAGQITVITRTGSLSDVVYDNALVDAALATAASEPRFKSVKPGVWHTGDLNRIWFARAGVPSLTLSAQDEEANIPNLHRPTDTIENVDEAVPRLAVDFAEATVRRLVGGQAGDPSPHPPIAS